MIETGLFLSKLSFNLATKNSTLMATVIVPFKIVGTIEDLNFNIDGDKVNRVREKGKTGVSSEQFKNYPCFKKVKNHRKEFGRCIRKAQNFRQIAYSFNKRAKDGSFFRSGQQINAWCFKRRACWFSARTNLESRMESPDAADYFIGFEGNKHRLLKTVLKKIGYGMIRQANSAFIYSFNPAELSIGKAHSYWTSLSLLPTGNYIDNKFTACYSQELILEKNENTTDIFIEFEKPDGEHLHLLFLFIGFSIKDKKRTKELKRSNNTMSIIGEISSKRTTDNKTSYFLNPFIPTKNPSSQITPFQL